MLGITKAQKIIKFYQITKESTPTVKNHTWNSDQYKKLDFQLGNTVFLYVTGNTCALEFLLSDIS